MNVNKGDKVTLKSSPYVWKIVTDNGDGSFYAKRVGHDEKANPFNKSHVLSIVERVKTADDYRELAQ